MNTTTTPKTPTLEQMPVIPPGLSFTLHKVDKVSMPHPYCITPKHVEWAAGYYGGILSAEAIEDAEKHGACCDICRQSHQGILPYHKHESLLTLFIKIPVGIRDLNKIAGLHDYLYENKAAFEQLGIKGFAFPS